MKNHSKDIWACDFLPVIDLWFRPLYLFFIIELATRRVVHFGVTRSPTDEWVAQQHLHRTHACPGGQCRGVQVLRAAAPFGQAPRFLIRDHDRKYGDAFARAAKGSSIFILKTPYCAPKANAICERFLGSVRRECLDRMLIFGKGHLYRVIQEYVEFFNQARPHHGLEQNTPEGTGTQRKRNIGESYRVSGARWPTSQLATRGMKLWKLMRHSRMRLLVSTPG